MYRYLALIWNAKDLSSKSAAQRIASEFLHRSVDWSCAFNAEGFTVFHSTSNTCASQTRVLPNAAGAVVGRIFNRNCDAPGAALTVPFDEVETSKIIGSEGSRLFSHYWGRYVAFIRNAATAQAWVLRDPMGAFPCFLLRWLGVSIVFSDLEDCLAVVPTRMSVNWRYIAGLVSSSGSMHTRETALEEVEEILPGECVCFSEDSIHRSNQWNPIAIAELNPIERVDDAVEALRSTTRTSVHAWAACYQGIVHNLSGGLDSSIVLSCLASAPTRPVITCLNYFSTGAGEDERKYARLTASHAGIELIEHQLDHRDIRLEGILDIRRSVRPWQCLYELERGPFESDMVSRYGVDNAPNGLFSGGGGDGVFYQAGAEFAVSDYLLHHGWTSNFLKLAMDAARLSRKSIWSLLRESLRTLAFGTRHDFVERVAKVPNTVISREVMEAAAADRTRFRPPWLTRAALRHAPPGVLWHALMMSGAPSYYSSFQHGPGTEHTMPLLSQPLVELCLRIPSYVLMSGGWDRAVARRAFSGDLPKEIVERRAKGNINQHTRRIMDHNLEFLRNLLLDGVLVREGLLNRDNLDRCLTPEQSISDHQYTAILHHHLCTEAWLRRWVAC